MSTFECLNTGFEPGKSVNQVLEQAEVADQVFHVSLISVISKRFEQCFVGEQVFNVGLRSQPRLASSACGSPWSKRSSDADLVVEKRDAIFRLVIGIKEIPRPQKTHISCVHEMTPNPNRALPTREIPSKFTHRLASIWITPKMGPI